MQQLLITLPIALPILFWAAYHYHKDRHLPEPPGHLVLTFGLGLVAYFIGHQLYVALGMVGLRFDAGHLAQTNVLGLFGYAMLVIGPIEELAKFLPFFVVVLRFREFDEPLDGIIYASFIGLGYAAIENWQYLEYLTPLEAFARGFASPVVHILFASIWGHWIAQAYLRGGSVAKTAAISVAIAAGLHGLYDFIVILNPRNALPIAALVIIAIWLWRLKLMRNLHDEASRDR